MTLVAQVFLQGAVGFAIGAGTNDLAIRWLFAVLFSKKKKAIAESVQDVVSKELMSSDKIVARISTPEVRAAIERDFRRQMDDVCDRASAVFGGLAGGLKQFVPEILRAEAEALAKVGGVFTDDARASLAKICAGQMSNYLSANLPRLVEETKIWNVIYDSIMGYDEDKMEFLTRQVSHRELRGITIWGGVIGALVGVSMSFLLWYIG